MKPSKFRLFIFLLIIPGLFFSACSGGDSADGGGSSQSDLAGTLSLLEDFSSGTIDPLKWTAAVLVNGSGPCTQSAITFSLEASQSYPATSAGDCGLEFNNSSTVASFSAEITVTAFSENPTFGPIRARLRGVFYNDGILPNAGFPDLTSDIFAQIYAKGTVVEASVLKCTAPTCASIPLMSKTILGAITLGSTHTLYLGWDGVNTFTFQMDSLTPLVFDASTAGAPFAGPAIGGGLPGANVSGSKVVELRGGSPAADGSITATFDNIRCTATGGGGC